MNRIWTYLRKVQFWFRQSGALKKSLFDDIATTQRSAGMELEKCGFKLRSLIEGYGLGRM